jgi:hypothetical protein
MSDLPHDLDVLALLWTEEPPEAERRLVEDSANRALRRARLIDHAEVGIALLIFGAILIVLALDPAPATMAVGAICALILLWSSWKRHALSQVAIWLETDDRCVLLEDEAAKVRAKLKRARLGLWLFAPSLLLGFFFAHSVIWDGDLGGSGLVFLRGLVEPPLGPLVLLVFVTGMLLQIRAVRRLETELSRLDQLAGSYRHERQLDAYPAR